MNRRILVLAGMMLAASFLNAVAVKAQALNPSYLKDMPAPARIISEIKGKDAEDTIERQMGAFQALMKMIDDMAYGLEHRYLPVKATPDENRIKNAYGEAYAELWHKAKNQEDHLYDHDWALLGELLTKLFPQQFRDLYAKSDANAAAAYQAFQEKNFGLPTAAPAAPRTTPALSTSVESAPGLPAETRRCIESGRSQRVCYSEFMSSGVDQLVGQLTGLDLKSASTAGLRMTGDYSGPQNTRLVFQPDKAVLTCSDVSSPLPYTVEIAGTQVLVKIQNGSKPVVFELRPDGKLAGSGQTRIDGITATGTSSTQTMGPTTQTTTTTRELTPLEAQNYPNAKQNGQTFTTTETSTTTSFGPTGGQTVNYQNRSANCTLGLMTATGPTLLPPDIENPAVLLTTIFSGAAVLMKGGTTQDAITDMFNLDKAPAPGLRLSGKYAGANNFSITFHPDSVTVACGEAEHALNYIVQRTANQTLLTIQDKTDPITLQLKPDGTFTGEGTAQVNGRTIVKSTDDPDNPFVFAPKGARCPIGVLAPR
jgi:hypothetical protein